MFLHFSSSLTLFFAVEWAIRLGAIVFVPRNRKPSSAMSWLMLIMLEPVLGLGIFLLIGSPKLSRRRRAMQATMTAVINGAVEEAMQTPALREYVHFDVPDRYQSIVALGARLGGMPAFSGNKIELLPDYTGSIQAIIDDIQAAKKFVHIEFFIMTFDDSTVPLFDAIEAAVERGVKVRVLLDALGSRRFPFHAQTKAKLTAIGAEWHTMLPLTLPGRNFNRLDLRNHRKIVVIDGRVGYTGSQNIIRRNYHRKDALLYDELMVRVQGPVVAQLHGTFITDWYSETEVLLSRQNFAEIELTLSKAGSSLAQVLPSGPGYDNENNLKLFTSLIYAAQHNITIVNPYFVPDDSLLTAITSAALRGVQVSILNSEIMDQKMVGYAQRSYYEALLNAGVKIHLYKYPILLHAKFITIDDDMAVIGSSNLDLRSFQLDLEVSLAVYDKVVVEQLHLLAARYLHHTHRVHAEDWKNRSVLLRVCENLARLTAALQ